MSDNERIVITGAAGALGNAVAKHFVKTGAIVTGMDLAEADPLGSGSGEKWNYHSIDLCDEDLVKAAFDAAASRMGGISLLINCCGRIVNEPVVRFAAGRLKAHPAELWRETMEANLTASFIAGSHASRIMVRQGTGGSIINFGSVSAGGNPGQVAYSAAKAALVGMSKAMARELGPLGVRVNVIAPGFIDVASTRSALAEDIVAGLAKQTPLGRLGEVGEIIQAIDMVRNNGFVNGAVIPVDGGFFL